MVERGEFPWGNMFSVIVSAWSSCIHLVTALRRVSLVWVSEPLLQLNLPCHYCSRAARLPAALSLDGRCEAASSVSSQGWLKCGRASEAECHHSSKGDVCVVQHSKACFIWMEKERGTWKRPFIIITANKCKHKACDRMNEWRLRGC